MRNQFFGTNASAGLSLPHELGDTPPARPSRRNWGGSLNPLDGTSAVRMTELVAQRSPTERGRRLRARLYALDGDEAMALRLLPEFAGEELTDAEISRLIGIYRTKMDRVYRFEKEKAA